MLWSCEDYPKTWDQICKKSRPRFNDLMVAVTRAVLADLTDEIYDYDDC